MQQRTRLAPHPSGGKLAVPKPVNLPSLRKVGDCCYIVCMVGL